MLKKYTTFEKYFIYFNLNIKTRFIAYEVKAKDGFSHDVNEHTASIFVGDFDDCVLNKDWCKTNDELNY